MRTDRTTQFTLFLFFLALFLLAAGDRATEKNYASDETLMIKTTISMLQDHSLRIPETFGTTVPHYGILQSVAAIPFAWLALAVAPHLAAPLRELTTVLLIYCTCAFLTALLLARFFGFSRALGYPRRPALAATLALGLTTVLFPYSKMFFSEPLVALTLLLSAHHLVRWDARGRARSLFLCGLWLGLALLTRLDNLILLPVYLLTLALSAARPRSTLRTPRATIPRGLMLFALPLLAALALQLWINFLRFGSPWNSGYSGETFSTPLPVGLFGLLFSPGRSLFFYSPALLVVPFVFARFFRRRPLGFFVLGVFVLKLLLYAKWWSWNGGWSWGSRFLLPAVPLLCLPLNELFLRWRRIPPVLRAAALALLALGLYVQLLAVLVSPNRHGQDLWAMVKMDQAQLLYMPHFSPLGGNPQLIRAGFIDSFLMHFREFYGLAPLLAVVGALGALFLFSAARLVRAAGLRPRAFLRSLRVPLRSRFARASAALALLNLLLFLLCAAVLDGRPIPFTSTAAGAPGISTHCVMLEEAASRLDPAGRLPLYTWRGWLWAPLKDEYSFQLKAAGRYQLMVDGKRILVNQSPVPQHVNRAALTLQPGAVRFELQYQPDAANYRLLRLYWTVPGLGIYEMPLTSRWIFAAPPSPLLRAIVALDMFKYLILALSLLTAGALAMITSRRDS